jgi:hypothetical protein
LSCDDNEVNGLEMNEFRYILGRIKIISFGGDALIIGRATSEEEWDE